jgi:hypothetical protein
MCIPAVLIFLTTMLLVVACASASAPASASGAKAMTAPARTASGEWLEDYQLALKLAATEKIRSSPFSPVAIGVLAGASN